MLKRKIPSAGTPVQLSDLFIAIKGAFGKEAPLLERIIEKLLNIKHCLLVNSGTTAFYVILRTIKKFSDKNEVILPAYTAPSLILSIKKAGLKPCRIHDLRHTFASQLVICGSELRDVKELLGHSSYTTTLKYAHLTKSRLNDAIDKLEIL